MPAIVALVRIILSGAFIKWVGRLFMIGAGFSLFSIAGLDVFLGQLEGQVRSGMGRLPAGVLGLLGLANVDLYINWLFLGFTVRMGMMVLSRFVPGRSS